MKGILRQLLLITVVLALASTSAFAGTVYYDYDPTGQLESVTNSTTTSYYTSDRTGNIMHVSSVQIVGDTQNSCNKRVKGGPP